MKLDLFEMEPPNNPAEADFRGGYHHGAVMVVRSLQAGILSMSLQHS